MFLSSIYITIVIISLLIFIFVSRRINLRMLIGNVMALIFSIILNSLPIFSSYMKYISSNIVNHFDTFFLSRSLNETESSIFLYINILMVTYIIIFLLFFFLSKLFIKNKSYFREFDNMILKTNLKVAFSIINTSIVLFVASIYLVNLNMYFKLEEGILSNIFSLAKKVIELL